MWVVFYFLYSTFLSSHVAKLLYSTISYIRVGGEANFFHCSRCDMCLGIQLKDSHKVRNNTGNLRCLLKWICAIKLSWTQIMSSHIILENSDLFQINSSPSLRNEFHSETSSFHLYTFFCICLHDTKTK